VGNYSEPCAQMVAVPIAEHEPWAEQLPWLYNILYTVSMNKHSFIQLNNLKDNYLVYKRRNGRWIQKEGRRPD